MCSAIIAFRRTLYQTRDPKLISQVWRDFFLYCHGVNNTLSTRPHCSTHSFPLSRILIGNTCHIHQVNLYINPHSASILCLVSLISTVSYIPGLFTLYLPASIQSSPWSFFSLQSDIILLPILFLHHSPSGRYEPGHTGQHFTLWCHNTFQRHARSKCLFQMVDFM